MFVVASSRLGFSRKRSDPAAGVAFHEAVSGRVVNRRDGDGHFGLLAPVCGEHGAEIQITEDVSVKNEKGAVKVLLSVLDSSRGSQGHFLVGVNDPDAESAAVAQVVFDGLGEMPLRQDNILDAILPQMGDDMLHEGNIYHRHESLGGVDGKGKQPRGPASNQNDGLHERVFLTEDATEFYHTLVEALQHAAVGRRRPRTAISGCHMPSGRARAAGQVVAAFR